MAKEKQVDPVCGMEVEEDTPYKAAFREKHITSAMMRTEKFFSSDRKYMSGGLKWAK